MRSSSAVRVTVGALSGVCAWPVLAILLRLLPLPLQFLLAWLVLTFGPGAAIGALLADNVDPLRRVVTLLGFGSAATPLLVVFLGRAHALELYPFVAVALAGIGIACWRPSAQEGSNSTSYTDWCACAALVLIAAGTGAIAFWHRLAVTPEGIRLFGAYDSMDLSYYAAMAADATHTVPPAASFYAGHGLNAAYYPQLILAMVHRFAAVPMLDIYFRYAWPIFLSLGALSAFVLARALAPVSVAFLAAVLILVAGDFSYLAAWILPHATDQWDYLLWPTNFLSPTMEVLHFNTWTPSLPVFFCALYAIVRSLQTGRRRWVAISAALVTVLFQFKPFAYIVLLAALSAAALFSYRDAGARRRLAGILSLSIVLSLPFVYQVATGGDRRSRFLIAFFLLPQRMLLKLDLTQSFEKVAASLAPIAQLRQPIVLLLATGLFFAGGLGMRWFGLAGVWRAIRRQSGEDVAAWRVLAWTAIAGILIPFVLVTDPYVDTLQFYQTGLYVLSFFTAVALVWFAAAHRWIGILAVSLVIGSSLPSSIHFLKMKWTDDRREPRAVLSRGEVAIANYLRESDPETTVILHDRPADPSLLAIVSERRVVLAWGHPYYAAGSAERLSDVNQFYRSDGGDASRALETLRRYHVTHVVVADRNRVHPAVLARLRIIIRSVGATLYAVPQPLAP
jgi:hypothetical protein